MNTLMSFVHLSSCNTLGFFLYAQAKKKCIKNIYIYTKWTLLHNIAKKKKKSGNIHTGHADFYDTFCELISTVFLTM